MTYDLIVRGGALVTPAGVVTADLGVLDGAIAALAPDLEGAAVREIAAGGLHVFPGGVDPHVHFNEPGRTHWEGIATGSAALAAGGVTTFFDMPLNAHPPTTDGAAFDRKRVAAEASSRVDFGLWGGLVPGRLDRLEELAQRGVVGFKAFMSRSGTDDFQAADDLTLYEGMAHAAGLGRLVAVHAESDALTAGLAARAVAEGRLSARDYAASRPVVAELEAIGRAIAFAEETSCALHVVHVSSGRGVALVAAAATRGVDVTCETCPHYLVLTEDDLETLGAIAKCAPPLRPAAEREALWSALDALAMVTSDHSPCPPELKDEDDWFFSWGGISGAQSTLPLLLTEGHHARGITLATVARLAAAGAAARFGLARKGRLEVGADADLALVDLTADAPLTAEALHYRHRVSPYVGRRMRARVERTLLRGADVYAAGAPVGLPAGQFLKRT